METYNRVLDLAQGENAGRQDREQVVGTRYESPGTRGCISDVHIFVSFLIVVTSPMFQSIY